VYALCSVSELAFTSLCKPRMLKSKIPHARPHRNAKYYTLGTAQGTVLMRNSAVELYRLAPSSFYKLAYVYIWQVRSTRIHVFACVCVILVACDSLIFHPPPLSLSSWLFTCTQPSTPVGSRRTCTCSATTGSSSTRSACGGTCCSTRSRARRTLCTRCTRSSTPSRRCARVCVCMCVCV
jgi:hypothetical protein